MNSRHVFQFIGELGIGCAVHAMDVALGGKSLAYAGPLTRVNFAALC